ncbi:MULTISPECIES: hypothetical protein, partial [Streptomyces]
MRAPAAEHPRRPAPWLRPTIRVRLTLLYGGMFLVAGVVIDALIGDCLRVHGAPALGDFVNRSLLV